MNESKNVKTFTITESQIERVIGIILFIFSLLLFVYIIPTQVKYSGTKTINPKTVPSLWTAVIMILSIASFINGWRTRNAPNQETVSVTTKELKLVLFTIFCIALCAFGMKYLPYLVVTIVVLIGMMVVFGQRNKLKIAIAGIGVPVLIYCLFVFALHLRLP